MDPALRAAWTSVVSADDYEQHMAAIGQAQAAAELTREFLESAAPGEHARVVFAGAGTGQMLDYLESAVRRTWRMTFTDLSRNFLARLRARLDASGISADVIEDDFEQTALDLGPDLLLTGLLFEHIDWRRGVDVVAALRPGAFGIVIQENPPGMTAALTPGRVLPPSIGKALTLAKPTLVPREELIAAFERRGFRVSGASVRDVADGKKLAGLLFHPAV